MLYISFLLIPVDYFRSLKWRVFAFEWLIPLAITIWVHYVLCSTVTTFNFNDYVNKVISLEGALVGFSIMSIIFLTTANNPNIEELKKHETGYTLGGKRLTLMHVMLNNFSYSLLTEIFILIANLTAPIIISSYGTINFHTKNIFFSISLFLVVHNLFLNIRNLSDIYFAVMKPQNIFSIKTKKENTKEGDLKK